MIKGYRVVSALNVEALAAEVAGMLLAGWQPLGGVSVYGRLFQAMVLDSLNIPKEITPSVMTPIGLEGKAAKRECIVTEIPANRVAHAPVQTNVVSEPETPAKLAAQINRFIEQQRDEEKQGKEERQKFRPNLNTCTKEEKP